LNGVTSLHLDTSADLLLPPVADYPDLLPELQSLRLNMHSIRSLSILAHAPKLKKLTLDGVNFKKTRMSVRSPSDFASDAATPDAFYARSFHGIELVIPKTLTTLFLGPSGRPFPLGHMVSFAAQLFPQLEWLWGVDGGTGGWLADDMVSLIRVGGLGSNPAKAFICCDRWDGWRWL
jgi:hypothetical protein